MSAEERESTSDARRKSALSVRWIFLGVLVLAVGVKFGNGLLLAHVVERNERLAKAFHAQDSKMRRGEEPSVEEKAAFKSLAFGNGAIVAGLAAMLLVLPLGVGFAIGKITATKRNAAIAVTVGMTIGFAITDVITEKMKAGWAIALAWLLAAVAIYAALGALAGLAGKRLAKRRATP